MREGKENEGEAAGDEGESEDEDESASDNEDESESDEEDSDEGDSEDDRKGEENEDELIRSQREALAAAGDRDAIRDFHLSLRIARQDAVSGVGQVYVAVPLAPNPNNHRRSARTRKVRQ